MGWTDDADTEGLIEENPFIFIALGLVGVAIAGVLYFVGIDYQPGWFEGQNLVSTMGIIFLIVFIPAIAISTLTGKSDLVKWEALFLLISVGMVLIGNGFDFSKFMQSFTAQIKALGSLQVNQILMALLIIIGIAVAVAVASGHKVSGGAVLMIVVLLAAIGIMNMWNAGTFDNIGATIQEHGWAYTIGKALSDFTGGLADGEAGMAIGFGCLVIGIILVVIPNFSTPIGVLLLIIGAGITGMDLWNDYGSQWFASLKGENGGTEQFKAGTVAAMLVGGPLGLFWFTKLYPKWLIRR